MRQNETDKKLTPKQMRAIEGMMSEATIRGAAKKAGIGHATLYRWLEEPTFVEALREARSQAFERTMTALAAAAEKAVEVLREILAKEEASAKPGASIRIRAVQTALGSMLRAHDLVEIEQRLKALEERLLGKGKNL